MTTLVAGIVGDVVINIMVHEDRRLWLTNIFFCCFGV